MEEEEERLFQPPGRRSYTRPETILYPEWIPFSAVSPLLMMISMRNWRRP